VSKLSIEPI